MAFCKFSTEYKSNNKIFIDRIFVTDYMPFAPESCTKVYLFGLNKCLDPQESNNTLDDFVNCLNMSIEDIKSSFLYWQEEGLVTVLNLSPIEVRYLPIIPKKIGAKFFDKEKYAEFNSNIQEIIDGRMITPNEYKEYYLLMSSMHIEESALIMIAKYCVENKNNNIGYNYIITVAKNWAYEGVHTARDVEQKISEMETLTSKVRDVLISLKSKKQPTVEDRDLYNKWTKDYGYKIETIIHIAKTVKRGGINRLDELINQYYSLKLFSDIEIDDYEKNKDELLNLAKQVCRSLGLYYDNLEPVINTYILKWKQMGFSAEAITLVANICFKKYIRTFEQMDEIVSKYYNKGIVSIDALNDYINQTLSTDKKIKEILEKLQLSRNVTTWDRDFYHTWTYSWKFNDELIDYALSLAINKSQPMTYVNKILSNWKEQKIDTIEKAKQYKQDKPVMQEEHKDNLEKHEFMTHSFSGEELNALFDDLDGVKVL